MASYEVNDDGVAQARRLIDDGKVDRSSNWSDAQPSSDDENREVERNGYQGFGRWHLAIDPEASEGSKSRYAFPYGDFSKVHRDGLIHAKQRAAQYGHGAVERAADDLLGRLDAD
jgi:hypothetical protein